jgi:transposase-like protein
VASKRYQEWAARGWWAQHIEQWRLSGLPRSTYCSQHGIRPNVFARWLKQLGSTEALQHKGLRKPKPPQKQPKPPKSPPPPVASEAQNKAMQAFWAMHVEAHLWSGLTAAEYASAHRLSPYLLREWRRRLDAEPLGVDWRELVHPSARPYVRSKPSPSANDAEPESPLTKRLRSLRDADGRPNRRQFSDEEKRAMVAETQAPGATVSAVARRHGVVTSVLFRWRAQQGLGRGERAHLVEVRLVGEGAKGPGQVPSPTISLPIADGAVAVELTDGRVVFATPDSDPDAVRRYVGEREAAR